MTVQVQTPYNAYTVSSPTTVFPYTFRLLSTDDLIVTVDGVTKLLGSDYTVSGVGADAGGNVTFLSALTTGAVLLKRSIALQRLTDYQNLGDFRAQVVNADFDRIVMALQDVGESNSRALRLPIGDATSPELVENVAARANKLLGFDNAGKPYAAVPASDSAQALRLDLIGNAEGLGADKTGNGIKRVISIPAVRLLTAATIVPALLIDGASGGPLYYDSVDTATADDSVSVFVDTAGKRWKRPGLGPWTAAQALAVGSGDEATALQNLLNKLTARLQNKAYTSSAALTLPANSRLEGEGPATSITCTGATNVMNVNAGSVLAKLKLISTSTVQGINVSANTTNLLIEDVDLSIVPVALSAGHGIQCNAPGCSSHRISRVRMRIFGYGVLYNTLAAGMNRLVIEGVDIESQNADAITINSPTAGAAGRITDVVIGNSVLSALHTGAAVNAGFGVSLAHVARVAVSNLVILESRVAAIHVEDASQYVSLSNIVGYNCYANGIEIILGSLSGDTNWTPVSITGGQMVSANKATDKSGLRLLQDTTGAPQQTTVSGLIVDGFDYGVYLGGSNTANPNSVFNVDMTVRNCNNAVAYVGANLTHRGTIVVDTVNYLVYTADSGGRQIRLGFFECRQKPALGIINRTVGISGAAIVIEGFSWNTTFSHPGGVKTFFNLFALPTTMYGTLSVTLQDTATVGSFVSYEGTVAWDGTTLTVTDLRRTVGGGYTSGAPSVQAAAGQIQFGYFNAGVTTTTAQIKFVGEYYG